MKKYVFFSLTLFGILILGIMLYKKSTREQNVFDQMYYTRVHKSFDWMNPGNPRGLFSNMKQLKGIQRDNEQTYTIEGWFVEKYKKEYLEDGSMLRIEFYDIKADQHAQIIISYYTGWQEDDPYAYENSYTYIYDVQKKTLHYSSSDPQNEKKDFLYEIFLRDWFEANPNTKYSLDSLGSFDLVVGE